MVYGQLCTKYIVSRCIWTKDSQGLVSTVVTPDSWKSASSKNLLKTAPNGIIELHKLQSELNTIGTGILEVCE